MGTQKSSKTQNIQINGENESDTESLFDDAVREKHVNTLYDIPLTKLDCKTQTSNDIGYLTINSSNNKSAKQLDLEMNLNRKKKTLIKKLLGLLYKKKIDIRKRLLIIENLSRTIDLCEELLSKKSLDDLGQCLAQSTPQITNMNNFDTPSTSAKNLESVFEEGAINNSGTYVDTCTTSTTTSSLKEYVSPLLLKPKRDYRKRKSRNVIPFFSEERQINTGIVKFSDTAERPSERILLKSSTASNKPLDGCESPPLINVKKGQRKRKSIVNVIQSSSEEEEIITKTVKPSDTAKRCSKRIRLQPSGETVTPSDMTSRRSERIRLQPPREPRSRFSSYILGYFEPTPENDQLIEALCQSMKRPRSKANKSDVKPKKRKLYSPNSWLSQLTTESSNPDEGATTRHSF